MILQVGVKVLLRNPEGKILLLKRSEEKYGKTSGSWDIPGGRIDPGTTLLENLEREVLEETRLPITTLPRLIAAQDIIRGEEKHVVRLTYVAETEGEPELDNSADGEHTEYSWIAFEELALERDLDVYVRDLIEDAVLTENSWA
jgi:8-oxo-dGTP diphosphatase